MLKVKINNKWYENVTMLNTSGLPDSDYINVRNHTEAWGQIQDIKWVEDECNCSEQDLIGLEKKIYHSIICGAKKLAKELQDEPEEIEKLAVVDDEVVSKHGDLGSCVKDTAEIRNKLN